MLSMGRAAAPRPTPQRSTWHGRPEPIPHARKPSSERSYCELYFLHVQDAPTIYQNNLPSLGVTLVLRAARRMHHPSSTAAPDENMFGDGLCQQATDENPTSITTLRCEWSFQMPSRSAREAACVQVRPNTGRLDPRGLGVGIIVTVVVFKTRKWKQSQGWGVLEEAILVKAAVIGPTVTGRCGLKLILPAQNGNKETEHPPTQPPTHPQRVGSGSA